MVELSISPFLCYQFCFIYFSALLYGNVKITAIPINWWTNNIYYIHTKEYLAIKKDATINVCNNTDGPCERSQSQKTIYCKTSFLWNVQKTEIYRDRSRLVVDRGWGKWRRLVGRKVIAKRKWFLFVVMKTFAWLV